MAFSAVLCEFVRLFVCLFVNYDTFRAFTLLGLVRLHFACALLKKLEKQT